MMKSLPDTVRVSYPSSGPSGIFRLPWSKSLLNRQLVLSAVCGLPIPNLPEDMPDDVRILAEQLRHDGPAWQAGEGGTTFRFLLAYLSLSGQCGTVHAAGGMTKRPIGPLVDTLRQAGAQLDYMGEVGYPPVTISGWQDPVPAALTMDASRSSQFASALLLSLSLVTDQIQVHLKGALASPPYLDMTLQVLRGAGASVTWQDSTLHLSGLRQLRPEPIHLEADWTAASYPYAMVALGPEGCGLRLPGLMFSGWQGDEAVADMFRAWGVVSTNTPDGIHIQKVETTLPLVYEGDFSRNPDLVQTIVVLCAVMGVPGRYTGLHTLRIKETDRLMALRAALDKCGVHFGPQPGGKEETWILEGKASRPAVFLESYGDHRMAMALSLLSQCGSITLRHPRVVRKSFPGYWKVLADVGFDVDEASRLT
jgi:3-phosphoshikimate 1-carboxyvinyltransferase